jgi:hypothetical protein
MVVAGVWIRYRSRGADSVADPPRVAAAVSVTYNEYFAIRMGFLDELAGLFTKRRYSAEPWRIA